MNALLAKLRREPVAFYGGILSALLVLLAVAGVDEQVLATVVTVATLVGIPVTRARVTPVASAPDDAGAVEPGSLALGIILGVALALLVAHLR